jgi:preprotein translocase subunit YajC
MYATVVGVDGDDVILEVAPGVEVRYVKRAIMQVLPDEEPVAEPDYSADDDEGGAHADAEAADHEAADHEAADADAEAADHEAADGEAADHDGDESPAQPGDDAPPPAGDESPNGNPTATADERRAPGSV